ncbi:MAG: hypothetical protein JWP97_4298 [Labilithrix sp.]|nr:hypothetical protein [Labilithrix sp.]
MSPDDLLGRYTTLVIKRITQPGAYVAAPDMDEREAILLPGGEIPEGAAEGDEIEVFVYRDSEGRLVATVKDVKVVLGEVAFLRVTENTPIGAFVDWGLGKELLVPFKEQTTDLRPGEKYAIGLYVDDTGRLAGTMRVSEILSAAHDPTTRWSRDEWVEGEAWRNEPTIGLFVIVERRFVGLLPKSEPHSLARGDAARFRIANVLADGKIELSLRGHAHEELAGDAQRILEALRAESPPRVGDRSSPEEIQDAFGLSKKAFKRAVGRLLKEGAVTADDEGYLRASARSASS